LGLQVDHLLTDLPILDLMIQLPLILGHIVSIVGPLALAEVGSERVPPSLERGGGLLLLLGLGWLVHASPLKSALVLVAGVTDLDMVSRHLNQI
jgi:hypothetical protein